MARAFKCPKCGEPAHHCYQGYHYCKVHYDILMTNYPGMVGLGTYSPEDGLTKYIKRQARKRDEEFRRRRHAKRPSGD